MKETAFCLNMMFEVRIDSDEFEWKYEMYMEQTIQASEVTEIFNFFREVILSYF